MSDVTPNTIKFAVTTHFDCNTVEDVSAFPKVCITAVLTIGKGKIHNVNTDEIKTTI